MKYGFGANFYADTNKYTSTSRAVLYWDDNYLRYHNTDLRDNLLLYLNAYLITNTVNKAGESESVIEVQ